MENQNSLYFPVFYNCLEITDTLTDEEFGILLRALLKHVPEGTLPNGLPPNLLMAYRFMLDSAMWVFNSHGKWVSGAKRSRTDNKSIWISQRNFDPEEAFQTALKRSYGKKEPSR